MMEWEDQELYDKARKRHTTGISRLVSDAEVIVGLETEIDIYREKIRFLEERLREEKKQVQIGNVITLKVNGNEYRYVIDNVEMMFDKLCVDTVIIKGHKVSV